MRVSRGSEAYEHCVDRVGIRYHDSPSLFQNINSMPSLLQLPPAASTFTTISTFIHNSPQNIILRRRSLVVADPQNAPEMAGRRPGSAHRVIKPGPPPNVRRGSSLSSAAHEQLEQFAQQASSTVEHDAHDHLGIPDDALDSPHDLDDADMLTNGSIVHLHPALHPSLPDTSFDMDLTEEDEAPQTAADIAFAAYGDSLKIDSALCKKLASETALREPVQRRHSQKLNIERRSNVEALLAQVTGELPARPCKNCHKGHGPWTQCVIYDGQMCGSCSNCWFNASGSRCTFHGMVPSCTCRIAVCSGATAWMYLKYNGNAN